MNRVTQATLLALLFTFVLFAQTTQRAVPIVSITGEESVQTLKTAPPNNPWMQSLEIQGPVGFQLFPLTVFSQYDLQSNGTPQQIICDPARPSNVHIYYMTSAAAGTWTDRGGEYLFSNNGGNTFTNFGKIPSGVRTGFPAISLYPNGAALLTNHSADGGGTTRAQVYADAGPGSSNFTRLDPGLTPSSEAPIWGRVLGTQQGKFVFAASVSAGVNSWTNTYGNSTWSGYQTYTGDQAETYAFAKASDGRIGHAYIADQDGINDGDVFYRESTNDGVTWSGATKIWDCNFSADSMGALRGLSLVFTGTTPHVSFEAAKITNAGNYFPSGASKIMCWTPGVNNGIAVKIADPTNVPVGTNNVAPAVFVPLCRPSIGASANGNALFVVFNAATTYLSIDTIAYFAGYFSMSTDNGTSWTAPTKFTPLTNPLRDWRYPNISLMNPIVNDTCIVHGIIQARDTAGLNVQSGPMGASAQLVYFRIKIPLGVSIPLTFRANMKIQAKKGLFNPLTDNLHVRGDFQTAAGDPGGNWQGTMFRLADPDHDSIYTLQVNMPASAVGTFYQFKFVKNTDWWENDPNRTFTLTSPQTVLPVYYFNNDSIFAQQVTNTIIFTADMTQIIGTGQGYFDPNTDSLLVMGLDWDGFGTIISGTRRMSPVPGNPTLFRTTMTVRSLGFDSTKWKFKTFPDNRFVNNGWELGMDRWFRYQPDNSTTTLPPIVPRIYALTPPLPAAVTIVFQTNMKNARNRYNGLPINPATIKFVGIKGGTQLLGNWGGNWIANDTMDGTMLKLNDAGVNGDLVAGDFIYSRAVVFPAGYSGGLVEYKYAAQYPGSDTVNGGITPLDNEGGFGYNHTFMLRANTPERLLFNFGDYSNQLLVVKPNGGEVYNAGEQKYIFWTTSPASKARLDFTSNNGTTWSAITPLVVPMQTSYLWSIPQVNSTLCKVRIVNTVDTTMFDISDAVFGIQGSTPQITWQNNMAVKDNGNIQGTLTFGMAPSATNGIDISLGEASLPPAPPAGNFDIRFELPVTPPDASLKDYRSDGLSSAVWQAKFQPGASGYPFTFTWDPASLPQGTFRLKDMLGGSVVNVDMKAQNSYTLSNAGIAMLQIEYSKQLSVPMPLSAGWNMVSIPVTANDMGSTALFPGANSLVYSYNNGYISATTLSNGKGYWVRYPSPDTFAISGSQVASSTVTLAAGWNMIGVYNQNVPVASITTTPAGIINSPFYGFTNSYTTPTVLNSSKGYWVRTSAAGVMNLPAVTAKSAASAELIKPEKNWGRVHVTDANGIGTTLYFAAQGSDVASFSLPPLPPAGVFDVRFASHAFAEVIGTCTDIMISGAEYPVSVKAEGISLRLKDKAASGKLFSQTIRDGETALIRDAGIAVLEVSTLEIPERFTLSQNYPNPFNPATTIQFALPEKANVMVSVYNQLGEKVATLLQGEYEAGHHQVEWNASALPSGIYFYEMRTEKFSSIKKLMLVK